MRLAATVLPVKIDGNEYIRYNVYLDHIKDLYREINSLESESFNRGMNHDEPMHCMIEIDGIFYPAIMQSHGLVTHKLSVDQKNLIETMTIREYTLDEQFHVWKVEPFEVTCNDGYKSMCYMADNRRSVIEVNFSKSMNLPGDGFDGQADIITNAQGEKWVYCPFCHKKHFPINEGASIRDWHFQCRNSNCKEIFIINS